MGLRFSSPPRHYDNQPRRVRRDRFAREDDDVGGSARRRFNLRQSALDVAPHCIAPKAARGTPVTTNRAVAISPGCAAHHAAQRVAQSLCVAPAIKTWRKFPALRSRSARRRSISRFILHRLQWPSEPVRPWRHCSGVPNEDQPLDARSIPRVSRAGDGQLTGGHLRASAYPLFETCNPSSDSAHCLVPRVLSRRANRASISTVSIARRLSSSTPATAAASSVVISPRPVASTTAAGAASTSGADLIAGGLSP